MTATTPGSLPLPCGSGSAKAVYALLVDAYEDGALIDVLNDHAAEARVAGRAAGYQHGYTDGADEADSKGYAKGYDDGYADGHVDGADRGYAEAVEALEGLLDKRRNKK